MYLHVLRQRIDPMPLSAHFKAQLSSEAEARSLLFYLELPPLLAPLFPGISPRELDELTVNNYLYFRFVLALEALLVQPGGPTHQQLIDCMTLHEHAMRGLSRLFPLQDDFWRYFHRCQRRYAQAHRLQRECAQQPEPWDEEQVEDVATGKAAICFAIVHALASLSRQGCSMQPLLDCLEGIHLASQYYDDPAGAAADGQAQVHFRRSLELADQLGLNQLRQYLQQMMWHCFGPQLRGVA